MEREIGGEFEQCHRFTDADAGKSGTDLATRNSNVVQPPTSKKLCEAVKNRAMINVEIDRTTLVASDTVNMLVKHYAQAIPGKT